MFPASYSPTVPEQPNSSSGVMFNGTETHVSIVGTKIYFMSQTAIVLVEWLWLQSTHCASISMFRVNGIDVPSMAPATNHTPCIQRK